MAGLGYKAFASGNVLTAADLQGYAVDQSMMKFATSTARTTALASPTQGMMSFLNDSGVQYVYYDTYNASTNPGGAKVAGWYPSAGSAMFYGTASRTAATGTNYVVGATGYTYTELSDPLNWHSASTNTDRITPTVAGLYRCIGSSQTAVNATGNRRILLMKNGGAIAETTFTSASTLSTNTVSAVISLNGSTDYVSIQTDQNSGSSLVVTAQFSVEFIRPFIV